jgi:hypothetical protein
MVVFCLCFLFLVGAFFMLDLNTRVLFTLVGSGLRD